MNEDLKYTVISLHTLMRAFPDIKSVQEKLDDFACVLNHDVEDFLRTKAITFDAQGWAKTHLLYTSYRGEPVLVGYFALANKSFSIKNNSKISKTAKRRIAKFGQFIPELNQYNVPSILIGQLGKNDKYGFLVSGNKLLEAAFKEIKKAQQIVGGKFVYLECADNQRLKDFYISNGFAEFGSRALERDEVNDYETTYLIQMLKYLK